MAVECGGLFTTALEAVESPARAGASERLALLRRSLRLYALDFSVLGVNGGGFLSRRGVRLE